MMQLVRILLVLLFTLTQSAAPLLHVHVGSLGSAVGVHVHADAAGNDSGLTHIAAHALDVDSRALSLPPLNLGDRLGPPAPNGFAWSDDRSRSDQYATRQSAQVLAVRWPHPPPQAPPPPRDLVRG